MKIDQKFRNRLGLFVQEQKAIVFPIVFLLFCNLKIPKQGIKMQIFFPEQVVETLQKWAPPRPVAHTIRLSADTLKLLDLRLRNFATSCFYIISTLW